MPSAACVFEELKVSCLDQWIPGSQKRSVMTLEENKEIFHSLRKKSPQRVIAKKKNWDLQ